MTRKKVSNNGGLNLKSLREKVKNHGIWTVPQQQNKINCHTTWFYEKSAQKFENFIYHINFLYLLSTFEPFQMN